MQQFVHACGIISISQILVFSKNNRSLTLSTQKVIHKGDECILKNNAQRSKWNVTGPGGLDMVVPSVSLIIPPPNPEAVDLSSK